MHFLHRGTASIGPLIAALKDGKSVTYEGREVLQLYLVDCWGSGILD